MTPEIGSMWLHRVHNHRVEVIEVRRVDTWAQCAERIRVRSTSGSNFIFTYSVDTFHRLYAQDLP